MLQFAFYQHVIIEFQVKETGDKEIDVFVGELLNWFGGFGFVI